MVYIAIKVTRVRRLSLVSVVYIAIKITWVRRLLQYLEGAGGNGTTLHKSIRILLYLTQFCIWRQVRYPSYGPWPHVPPHVLVVILWALMLGWQTGGR